MNYDKSKLQIMNYEASDDDIDVEDDDPHFPFN